MKILHLIYDHIYNPWVGGGGAIRVYEIYKRLADRHHITLVCGKYPGVKDSLEGNLRFRFLGVSINNYVLSTFFYALKAGRFLKKNRYDFDIVIEDFAPYNPIFSFLWQKDAIIQLHQKEGLHHIRKHPFVGLIFWFIETIYPKLFKNAVTVSELNKIKFNLLGNVAVISNGFDTKMLKEEGVEDDYVLYLGRLEIDQKGLDILHKALEYIKIRLIIAGKGIAESKVKKMFKEHINIGMTKIVGFVKGEEKIDLLKRCLFLVMPSRYEGQPNTMMDAAACGKPLIVSDIHELRCVIDAGFGLSFKNGDAEDLADKMRCLLENESLRKEMGQKGREFSKGKSWDRVAEEYERFLLKHKNTISNKRD